MRRHDDETIVNKTGATVKSIATMVFVKETQTLEFCGRPLFHRRVTELMAAICLFSTRHVLVIMIENFSYCHQ